MFYTGIDIGKRHH